MAKLWRIWCKTMGNKISEDDREADAAAVIRTFFWLIQIITCGFIIANTVRHWDCNESKGSETMDRGVEDLGKEAKRLSPSFSVAYRKHYG